MKATLLFLFFICSHKTFSQTEISVKIHLLYREGNEKNHLQKNTEGLIEIFPDVVKNITVNETDVVFFYINNEMMEHIEISKNILNRKELFLTLSYGTLLEELKIDNTSLTKSLGLGSGIIYTKEERAARFDNQMVYNDPKYTGKSVVTLDGFVNKLSGRAKINKKALEMDVELTKMQRFLSVYTPDFLYEHYQLPKDQAVYFAMRMVAFIEVYTNLVALDFKEKVKEEIIKFMNN